MGRKSKKVSRKASSSEEEKKNPSPERESEPEESPLPVKRKKTEAKEEKEPIPEKSESEEEEYVIESIVDEKIEEGKKLYRVRWEGYVESEDTWETKSEVKHSAAYSAYINKKKSSKKKKKNLEESPLPNKKMKTEIKEEKETLPQKNEETDEFEEEEFEIEAIVDDKIEDGKQLYRVRWKGYVESDDTWETKSEVKHSSAFHAYKKKFGKKKNKITKSPAPAKKSSDPDTEEWEVSRIVDMHTKKNGEREFLVHWKGFKSKDDSWEAEETISHLDVYHAFLKKLEKIKELPNRELRVQRNPTDRLTYMPQAEARRGSKRFKNAQRVKYYEQD